MGDSNPTKNYKKCDDDQALQTVAYMFAGLAMMLNIRLSYSAAPFALLRFKLPENLFSVFVRTTSSALELWCIPSMLIGNIMEQFFINTQDEPANHYLGFKHETSEIQNKANQLKNTAGTQSNSELGHTNLTDLNKGNNNPETGLTKKAEELKVKADQLSTAANSIAEAAQTDSTLNPLSSLATQLKEAAKNEGSGLYQAAEKLEQAGGQNAQSQADEVITAFDKVENQYNLLMEQAKTNKLTNKDKVTAVIKEYLEVKNTYYQMLIPFRIKKKANTEIGDVGGDMILKKASLLYTKADELSKASGLKAPGQQVQDPHKEQLIQLATELAKAVGADNTGLQQALNDLKGAAEKDQAAQIVAKALEVITKYKKVEEAYSKVKAKEKEYTKLASPEYTPVGPAFTQLEEKFGVLQKSIVNVLWLRVQELANLAEELKTKASNLAGAEAELQTEANALRDAAMGDGSGLKEKAIALVRVIKASEDSGGTNAKAVIQAFEAVTNAYNALAEKDEYKQKLSENDEKVQNVDKAYKALEKVYNSILNFTKIKHYSEQLHDAASGGNSKNAITNFNSLVAAYDQLGEIQSIVQTQFTDLKDVYSDAIYFYKKCVLTWPSIITNWLNFLTFVILLIIYVTGGDQGHVTGYYWIMAISGFVFGINMVLVYAVDYRYLAFYMAGENSFPMVTSLILYFATSIFGNRRKYNSDYLVVLIDISIAILIALVASVLWTVSFYKYKTPLDSGGTPDWPQIISPIAMVIVGMGLVYSIYPGIAPGMIVPFYLIDKIEMVLLIATAFPPIIIAFLRKYAKNWSPQTDFLLHSGIFKFGGWTEYQANKDTNTWPVQPGDPVYAWIWHFFDILIPLQISLAVIFIYSLHYRDSSIARSIINQPKMSTFLSIVFYMCHEILLALGFPGMVGNNGAGGAVLLPVQYVGALLMVFLAFYSIGYITEYKKHDASQWPTEGMTTWNSLCYWLKMASKITNKNFKQLFTTDLRRDLLLCIQKNELI